MSGTNESNDVNELESLHTAVAAIQRHLETRRSETELQQQAFDTLYEELRQYKENFLFQTEKPLLLDLLLFYDSLTWFRESLIKQQMSPEVILDSFQYLIDEFLEVLYRRDVTPTESAPRFNRKTQKAIKVLAAVSQDQDQEVAQVLKRGFTRGERTLRSEEVVIYRYGGSFPDDTSRR